MRAMSRSVRRLTTLGVVAALAGLVACEQDDISGPVEQIGPPLLDMEIAPAASAPLAGQSMVLSGTNDTLVLTFANLPAVPTGTVYQVYLVDTAAAGANAIAATGELVVTTTGVRPVNRDSSVTLVTVDTTAATNTIAPAVSNASMTFTITDASIGGSIAAYTHAVVDLTTAPQAGAFTLAADAQEGFLSRRFRSGGTFSRSGTFTVGTWSITNGLRRPFSIQGSAIAAFVGDDCTYATRAFCVADPQIRATFERVLRPPEGFEYVGWLLDERTGIQLRLGGLLTPVPENRPLTNADTETGSFLTDVAIVNSQLRAPVDIADNYTRFVLVLEPKGAAGLARAPLSEVLQGAVPVSVGTRHPGAGKVFGKVTGTNSDGATVYLTGRGRSTPLLVSNADANGDFRFRTVQVGLYTINAIPAGDSVVAASQDVTIGVVAGTAVGDSVFVTLNMP